MDIEALKSFIRKDLEPTRYFLVDVTNDGDNNISVEIDSNESVDIDECVALSRAIEAEFDRDVEDYSLEVGSAGLTSPFKVKEQYLKNIGNEVEVLADGKKYRGRLVAAGDEDFTIETEEKVKREGEKRPVKEIVPHTFAYDKIKYTKYLIQF